MKKPWARRLLRLAAFCPALLLGAWLVDYTQREAARPPTALDPLIAEATKNADPFQDPLTIDLDLAPEVVEFEGFIRYGEPIQATNAERGGFIPKGSGPSPHVIRVTSKRIEMPIFNTRKITNQPTPWLGDTATAASDRKGFEPWLADFIDRLSRNFGGKSATP